MTRYIVQERSTNHRGPAFPWYDCPDVPERKSLQRAIDDLARMRAYARQWDTHYAHRLIRRTETAL